MLDSLITQNIENVHYKKRLGASNCTHEQGKITSNESLNFKTKMLIEIVER